MLDAHLRLVPIGMPGELMVSGIQLARGYLTQRGLPDQTAEKFIPNPYSMTEKHHDRLYRTGMLAYMHLAHTLCAALFRKLTSWHKPAGDLARWLPNGTIDFMGRLDQQVQAAT